MSAVTVAELRAVFSADTTGLDKAALSARQTLVRTAVTAEESAEAMLHLTAAIGATSIAYEAGTVQAATYTRVVLDSAKASQAATAAFAEATKGAVSVESALDIATVAAASAGKSFAGASLAAAELGKVTGATRAEVAGLGRSLGSNAPSGYATRTQASVAAVEALGIKATTTTSEVAALNAALAEGRTLRLAPGGGGVSGNGGGGAIRSANAAGSALTRNLSLPIIAVDLLSAKLAGDFEDSLYKVNSLAHLDAAGFDAMRASVLALADDKRIVQMPDDLAQGLLSIVGSGFKGAAAMDVLKQSAYGATAGMTTTQTASAAVVATLNSHVKGVTTAKEAQDVLFRTVDLGVVSYEELAHSIGKTLPTAAAFGVSLQEMGAAVAAMTRQGISGAESLTSLNNLMLHIAKPSKDAAEMMKDLGIEYGATALQTKGLTGWLKEAIERTGGNKQALTAIMPELRGLRGLLALANDGGKSYTAMLGGMATASRGAGAQLHSVAEREKAVNFQAAEARKQLALAAIAMGDELVPAARDVIAVVRDASKWFLSLDKDTRQNIIRWGLYAAATGPVIKGLGLVAGGVKSVVGGAKAFSDWGKTAKIATDAAGAGAEAAAGKMSFLAGAARGLAALAMNPIVFTVSVVGLASGAMYAMGKHELNELDKAKTEDTKRFKAYENNNLKTARRLLDKYGKGTLYDPTQMRASGYSQADADRVVYDKGQDARYARFNQEHEQSLKRAAAQDAAKKVAEAKEAAVAEARRVATASRAGGIASAGGGGGRKRGGGGGRSAREETNPLDQYREKAYDLEKATRLGTNATESASLAYDIAARHLDGYSEAMSKGNRAQANAIVQAAKHNLNLQVNAEKAEQGAKAHQELADSIKKAQENANEASRALMIAKPPTWETSDPLLKAMSIRDTSDPVLDALSLRDYGVRFRDLPARYGRAAKQIQQALAQAAQAAKAEHMAGYDGSDAKFDDGSEKAAEKRKSVLEKSAEAAKKSIEQFDALMRANSDKRDEGKAASSLAARRDQYVKEQVAGLKSTGDLGLDMERQRAVAKAAGEAFDATPIRAYRSAIRDLTRQLAELGPRTDEARLAAIRFDADGLEKMDEGSARAILKLEKLTESMTRQRDNARQAGDALGQAFTGAMTSGLNTGFTGFLRALVSNVDAAIRQAVLAKIAGGISNAVLGLLGPKEAAKPSGGGGFWGSIGSVIAGLPHKAGGGPVSANRAVVVGDGGNGSGTEVFVPTTAGNILPNEFVQGVTNMANSRNESRGGDTHNNFNYSPVINATENVDQRSRDQIKAAAFEGAHQAWLRAQ